MTGEVPDDKDDDDDEGFVVEFVEGDLISEFEDFDVVPCFGGLVPAVLEVGDLEDLFPGDLVEVLSVSPEDLFELFPEDFTNEFKEEGDPLDEEVFVEVESQLLVEPLHAGDLKQSPTTTTEELTELEVADEEEDGGTEFVDVTVEVASDCTSSPSSASSSSKRVRVLFFYTINRK